MKDPQQIQKCQTCTLPMPHATEGQVVCRRCQNNAERIRVLEEANAKLAEREAQ